MTYVGDEGIYAAWYSFYYGVLPEIAWIKSGYGIDVKGRCREIERQGRDSIPQVIMDTLIEQLEMTDLNTSDKAQLLGLTNPTYHQYKSRLKRRKRGE